MPSRNPENELRHEINKRAWAEAEERARYDYDVRRTQLLEEAGLPPPRKFGPPQQRRRDERTRRFHEFSLSLLADDTIASNEDFLDAIEPFLQEPTTANRIALTILLKKHPQWLGNRLEEFLNFA